MSMFGEEIIVRSITASRIADKFGNFWQYHSRSDRHSKLACWAVMFDLLRTSSLLQTHVAAGKVGFGINHELRDFRQDRKKNLDLVLCSPESSSEKGISFADYGRVIGIVLSEAEETELAAMPIVCKARVSNVFVAVEAKACMTEHVKAQPRLHDELASSHTTIHGDTNGAIAAAFVMINCADSFVSPDRNRQKVRGGKFIVNRHRQPSAATAILNKVMKLPRRSDERDLGFDAMGIAMVRCCNDGSPVVVDAEANAQVPDIVTYAAFIDRLAHLYSTRFKS